MASFKVELKPAAQKDFRKLGDYRVIYEVAMEASTIIVHYVRHRREVYRSLK